MHVVNATEPNWVPCMCDSFDQKGNAQTDFTDQSSAITWNTHLFTGIVVKSCKVEGSIGTKWGLVKFVEPLLEMVSRTNHCLKIS